MSDNQMLFLQLLGLAILGVIALAMLAVAVSRIREYFAEAADIARKHATLVSMLGILLATPVALAIFVGVTQ